MPIASTAPRPADPSQRARLRAVDVAFTPAGARRADVTVVIDVLRATTTIVRAFEAGYRRVLCAATLDAARALDAPGRVLAGERRCVRPPGFTLGNSPQETDPPQGDVLVLATTNGTPAILRAAALSNDVLIGCLRNLDAVLDAVGDRDVQLLCAGTDGRPSVEDTYVAGRLAQRLGGQASDAALLALAVAGERPDALSAGTGGRALIAAGLARDLAVCGEESVDATVPTVRAAAAGVATLEPLKGPR
jgi:2-phosphosulfolactate phosphatase